MGEIAAVLGLGNPGADYAETKHNLGYMVVDRLLGLFGGVWRAGRGEFVYAPVRIAERDVFLLRSTTFMNASGVGARDALESLGIPPEGLLVVLDDFAIPFGELRLRRSGSDGGHNGLASIIFHLGTERIPRLRVGIGPLPDGGDAVEFVLSEFPPEQRRKLPVVIDFACSAVETAVALGIEAAMNQFNRRRAD